MPCTARDMNNTRLCSDLCNRVHHIWDFCNCFPSAAAFSALHWPPPALRYWDRCNWLIQAVTGWWAAPITFNYVAGAAAARLLAAVAQWDTHTAKWVTQPCRGLACWQTSNGGGLQRLHLATHTHTTQPLVHLTKGCPVLSQIPIADSGWEAAASQK